MQYIAFDVHKRYTWARVESQEGQLVCEKKVVHRPGALRAFLEGVERGSPVAIETVGNWYWVAEEVEAAGCTPQLVSAARARLMPGGANKTDRLDCRGLVRLQRAGTLPVVWIPPREMRDVRELVRGRMLLVQQRTRLKNRIHSTLSKYGLAVPEVADLFGKKGRQVLRGLLDRLPPQTAFVTARLLEEVEALDARVRELEERLGEALEVDEDLPADDPARGGVHPGGGDPHGGGRREPVCGSPPAGGLRRGGAPGGGVWRQAPVRRLAPGCQPVPAVGLRRGGQRVLPVSVQVPPPAREPAVRAGGPPPGAPQGHRCGGTAPGGGGLLDPGAQGAV